MTKKDFVVPLTDIFPSAKPTMLKIESYGMNFSIAYGVLSASGNYVEKWEKSPMTPWQRGMIQNYLARLLAVDSGDTVSALMEGAL